MGLGPTQGPESGKLAEKVGGNRDFMKSVRGGGGGGMACPLSVLVPLAYALHQ